MTNTIDTRRLLEQYADVCNRAVAENVGEFWHRVAARVSETLWAEPNFRTVVYDHAPANVIGEHVIHFDAHHGEFSVLPDTGPHEVALTWKVPLQYLEDVVHVRPRWYIAHPTRLDWKWAGRRLRTSRLAAGAGGLALGALLGALSARYLRGSGRASPR